MPTLTFKKQKKIEMEKKINDKVFVDGGMAIETPFFKYKKAGARYDIPPEGAEIIVPNGDIYIDGEPWLVIKEKDENGKKCVMAPSFFKEYYARCGFSSKSCFAPFFSNTESDCFSSFYKRKDEVMSLLKYNDVNFTTRQTLYRLTIVYLVAAIDSLISDFILFVATKDRDLFLKAVDFAVPNRSKNKIMERINKMWYFNKIDSAEQEVIDYILRKSYSNLEKIQKTMHLFFNIEIDSDERINKIIYWRHLISHRNGRNKDGAFIEFNSSEIFLLIDELSKFVDNIKLKISSSDIFKRITNDN